MPCSRATRAMSALDDGHRPPQLACAITRTSERTHDIIRANFDAIIKVASDNKASVGQFWSNENEAQGAFRVKAPLNATNYEAASTAMRLRKDDVGETLDVTPSLIVVPPQLQWDAMRLFGRNILPQGEENIHQGGIKWIVANRLTGA